MNLLKQVKEELIYGENLDDESFVCVFGTSFILVGLVTLALCVIGYYAWIGNRAGVVFAAIVAFLLAAAVAWAMIWVGAQLVRRHMVNHASDSASIRQFRS